MAMYKTGKYRNGQGNAGNAENRGNAIFQGMFSNIPGNDAKHSRECCQTFGRMSDFIVTLHKDKISLLEQQVLEKNAIIDFFCKTEDIAHSNIFR